LDKAADLIRRHIEPGADVQSSAAELAVRFRTAKAEDELAKLLTALVSAGVSLTQFREVQTDLEEAFLSVARADDSRPTETRK
jgi:ABC-2 type transport system ATP-binding protein